MEEATDKLIVELIVVNNELRARITKLEEELKSLQED